MAGNPQLMSSFIVCVILLSATHVLSKRSTIHRHTSRISNSLLSNEVEDEEQEALLHSQRVSEAGSCEVPKQQVIHVSDHYPGKYYLPHCTLLHRCGKHAGCCGTNRLRCVADKKEKVILHFYSVRMLGDGTPTERKIEKLVFHNHTRCACVPVDQDL